MNVIYTAGSLISFLPLTEWHLRTLGLGLGSVRVYLVLQIKIQQKLFLQKKDRGNKATGFTDQFKVACFKTKY